jgi:hypothetical protein
MCELYLSFFPYTFLPRDHAIVLPYLSFGRLRRGLPFLDDLIDDPDLPDPRSAIQISQIFLAGVTLLLDLRYIIY